MVDLNINMSNFTSLHTQQVANLLATYGLKDLLPLFKQWQKHRGLHTWTQTRLGICYKSRCDYILGSSHHLFRSITIKDPIHFSTNHYMLVGNIQTGTPRSHQ